MAESNFLRVLRAATATARLGRRHLLVLALLAPRPTAAGVDVTADLLRPVRAGLPTTGDPVTDHHPSVVVGYRCAKCGTFHAEREDAARCCNQ